MTRVKGKITSWNDDKGYGFINAMVGDERTFVHISAFAKSGRRPVLGDVVTYSVSTDPRGRTRAEGVTIAEVRNSSTGSRKPGGTLPYVIALGFLLVLTGVVLLTGLPIMIWFAYLVLSFASFVVYAHDKSAARRGAWRTPESTLHLLALAGGWPGALMAQNLLRHKSRKQSFRAVFWVTVVLNIAALYWLLTPAGAKFLQSISIGN